MPDAPLLPRGPLIAATYYAPPASCWVQQKSGVPCAPKNPAQHDSKGGPDWRNPDLLWWALGGMRVRTTEPEKAFWPLSGTPKDPQDILWSELAAQSRTGMMEYTPCSCSLAGTCKFYDAVENSGELYECEWDELYQSKAAEHLRSGGDGGVAANSLAHYAPTFDGRFGGAYLHHGPTAWQGLPPERAAELRKLDGPELEEAVRAACHDYSPSQLQTRGVTPVPKEALPWVMPGYLCMREPVTPWRPILQPLSHDTVPGGCAVEMTDVEGQTDGGPHRFCAGRADKPCLWVYEGANAFHKVRSPRDLAPPPPPCPRPDLRPLVCSSGSTTRRWSCVTHTACLRCGASTSRAPCATSPASTRRRRAAPSSPPALCPHLARPRSSSARAQALRLLRPSFGPTPALPEGPESAAMEGVPEMAEPQREWEAFASELAALGAGPRDSLKQKNVAEKKASVPHSDAPFVGGAFVFQGTCRLLREGEAPPAAVEGFDSSYAWLRDHLEKEHSSFFTLLSRGGGDAPDLPFCSPTSPDLNQVKRTASSFVRSEHHYARACKAGAGSEGRDESQTAEGHACVLANGDDNPDDSVKQAYAPRMPTTVVRVDADEE